MINDDAGNRLILYYINEICNVVNVGSTIGRTVNPSKKSRPPNVIKKNLLKLQILI